MPSTGTGRFRAVVADIETDGLLAQLTRVHCVVLRDVETGALLSCSDSPEWAARGGRAIADGLAALRAAERVYFHNGIGFDYPALRAVYPEWDMPRATIRDTLLMAQMLWPDIRSADLERHRSGRFPAQLIGSHSLRAWGHRLGCAKGEAPLAPGADPASRWATWTPDMQMYCEQDTAVTLALVRHIRAAGVPMAACETEHALAWYLAQQERNGWPFDIEAARALQATLAARREVVGQDLRERFGSWVAPGQTVTPARNRRVEGAQYTAGSAYTKIKHIDFNPASRDHIANRLRVLYGWTPEQTTPSGKPQVDADALDGLDARIPAVGAIREYLLLDKRLGQIAEGREAWLRYATEDGPDGGRLTGCAHIHGRVRQCGTVTHRAAHMNPNVGQVPRVGNPFGAECRALWRVPPGWVQVGADLASLEARCLAHYMATYDGGAYATLLLDGDVHAANRDALGLPQTTAARDVAKGWYYAYLYGAGDAKLGTLLLGFLDAPERGGVAALGRAKREEFLGNTPALAALQRDVQRRAATRGHLITLDGRTVPVRSRHAALNTLLQSAGAIITKRWIVETAAALEAAYGPQGWRGKWAALGWIHDEVQLAARPEIGTAVGETLVASARALTVHFALRVPLDAAARTGANWRETH